MNTIQIVQLSAGQKLDAVVSALRKVNTLRRLVLGSTIQDPNLLQITAGLGGSQEETIISALPEICHNPRQIIRATYNMPIIHGDSPVTAPLVEHVQGYFPASKVTPEFQQQIESDMQTFHQNYVQHQAGFRAMAWAWTLDEVDHEDIKGEKAKCLLVLVGWDTMADFQRSFDSDACKDALKILLAWNTPFNMVSLPCCIV